MGSVGGGRLSGIIERESRGEPFGDGSGDGSYTGGGTNDAFLGLGVCGPAPASRAAWRSDA